MNVITACGLMLASSFGAGCTDPGSPADPHIDITATGGFGGDGTTADPNDGADETAGPGPGLADHCLFEEEAPQYGLKYQCAGYAWLTITVNSEDPRPLNLYFGAPHEVDATDSYEAPQVMACCPELDTSCFAPHEQACIVDLVEQGCKSISVALEELADDMPGIANALNKAALWVNQESSQIACLNAFLVDTGVATTEATCGTLLAGQLSGASWSFNPDTTNLVDDVKISISGAQILNVTPSSFTDEFTPDQCASSNDNDGVFFLEVDPNAGDTKTKLSAGGVALSGPQVGGQPILGEATLSSASTSCAGSNCSHAAWSVDAQEGRLHSMSLYSSGINVVGTTGDSLSVDSFGVHLYADTVGVASKDGFTIAAGNALFVLSAEAMGGAYKLSARNSTPVQLRHVGDHWSMETFSIDYADEAGDIWSLAVGPTIWQP